MPDPSPADKPPFARLGRYEVGAKIAEGGMAVVYVGRSPDPAHRLVALKVIRREYARDMQFLAMFLDEAKLTARLNHPNIVKVYEQASHDGQLFIAMELLFGQSLGLVWEASTKRGPRVGPELVAFIGARTAEALHHAHELRDEAGIKQDVIHRDINPSNIFVTYGGQVKIVDFGLAKAVDRLTSTVAGVVKGKLAYMSPEQVGGPGMDRRADLFSLGITLWEVTCNRRLFKSDNDAETLRNVRDAKAPDPRTIVPGYPPALAAIVMRALAADPAARYQTAAEMAKELDAFVMSGGRIVTPSTLLEAMSKLFAAERDRDAKWYEGMGLPIRTVPLAPIPLSSTELKTEMSLPNVAGTLAPPSSSPAPLVRASALPTSPGLPSSPGPPTSYPLGPGQPVSREQPTSRGQPSAPALTSPALPRPSEPPTPAALTDPTQTPIEPSTGAGPAGVPSGVLGSLSPGEIIVAVVLSLAVLIAMVTGLYTLGR